MVTNTQSIYTFLKNRDSVSLAAYLKETPQNKSDLTEALKWTCINGTSGLIEVLIEAGADINHVDEFGSAILHFATRGKREDVITSLLAHGINFDEWNQEGESLLLWACHFGLLSVVRVLTTVFKQSIESPDSIGRRCIHLACVNEHLDVIKYLIGFNCHVINSLDENGWSALHYVSAQSSLNQERILQTLIQNGADPLLKTPDNKTALDIAYECGSIDSIIKALSVDNLLQILMVIDNVTSTSVNMENSNNSYIPRYSFTGILASQNTIEATTDVNNRDNIILGVWRKILQNDDVDLLKHLRDSCIWERSDSKGFEADLRLTNYMKEIFYDCNENGLSIYSFIQLNFDQQIKEGNFKSILCNLTGLVDFQTQTIDNCEIFQAPYSSLIFLALICGRFRVVEELIRIRQFDLVPMTILLILIIRRMENEPVFTKQTRNTLETFADLLESLAVDATNKTFLADTYIGKQVTLDLLDLPLKTFGNVSIIDLADKAKCTSFLCLPCCQMVLDDRWFGKLSQINIGWQWALKIFPFLLIIYMSRSKMDDIFYQTDTVRRGGLNGTLQKNHLLYMESNFWGKLWFIRHVYRSPCVKFFYHSLSHFIFLAVFSYVVVYEFHYYVTRMEGVCIFFVIGYGIDEMRQFIIIARKSGAGLYIRDVRNFLDMVCIFITSTGFLVRCLCLTSNHEIPNQEEAFDSILYLARTILLTGLLLFYIRLLFILFIFRIMGPKLKMIGGMLKNDLLPLLAIFAIFVVAFGVVFQGLMFPNGYQITGSRYSSADTMLHIYRHAFYGMFSVEYISGELECTVSKTCENQLGSSLVYYLFNIIYIFIVNIVLVNLLIALFSNTVSTIDQESVAHWFADRYQMIEEYRQRSVFPPPFNLITVLIEILCAFVKLVYKLYRYCCHHRPIDGQVSKRKVRDFRDSVIVKFVVLQSFALRSKRPFLGPNCTSNQLNKSTDTTKETLDHLEKSMEEISDQLAQVLKILGQHHGKQMRKFADPKERHNDIIMSSVRCQKTNLAPRSESRTKKVSRKRNPLIKVDQYDDSDQEDVM